MDETRLSLTPQMQAQLNRLKDIAVEAGRRRFVFLLVGRTGVGKSSTVNTLMGQEVAPVGHFEPTTMSVERFKSVLHGINYAVVDTPGLCDDLPEAGNDDRYLDEIRDEVSKLDCLWYVTRLDETRITGDEKRGIKLITQALGKEVWKRAIIVFTYAGNVKAAEYETRLAERARLVREEIGKATEHAIRSIPHVAVDNTSPTTPDGKPWLGNLYVQVLKRLNKAGALPFLLATAEDIRPKEGRAARIQLSAEQKAEVKEETRGYITELVTVGAGVGFEIGGPLGAAVGGALGALIGWLFE
ncbi:MAG: 50S ribosome-binding GTPase [Deltaproteobacteria bacterium]|nr:50S ribosome-binding GTPase [Deltaproteobacteria bacterium]